MNDRLRVAAVVLAAGAGTRFGGPKQRLFLPSVVATLREAPVDPIVVVAGAYPLDVDGARVVEFADWERGPGASLRRGLRALPRETEAAVVCLADGPRLRPAAVERVIARWRRGAGEVVAASYGGERGHPVLLGRPVWPTIPDEGARTLEADLVPCDDIGSPGDVDTADQVGRLEPPIAEL